MTGALPVQLWKELRALLPWWAALVPTVAILGAANQMQRSPRAGGAFLLAAGFVYVAGAAALGALSFGHDYSHRTLGTLLALPVSRRRLLLLKAAVLLPMLALMGLVAVFTLGFQHSLFTRYGVFDEPAYQLMIFGPMLAGALLAPWLTMVARGPLGGAVFSVAIPVLTWMVCNSFLLDRDVVWRATLVIAAIGGVMTVRTFIRQEAIDGPQSSLALPGWLRRSDQAVAVPLAKPRHWIGIALWKELRLQQMTFVVAGLYVAAWMAVVFARWITHDDGYLGNALYAITSLYGGTVAIMAGALPAAEERHYGTADWQLLMPIAAWKQWILKSAVAVGLATILALGLPVLVLSLAEPFPDAFSLGWEMLITVLLFSVAGLYVSSISPTGLRAVLATVPAIAAISVAGAALFQPLGGEVRDMARAVALHWITPGSVARPTVAAVSQSLAMVMAGALSLLVLTLAFHNHRSAERSRGRISRQAALIIGAAGLAALVLIAVGTFLMAGVETYQRFR